MITTETQSHREEKTIKTLCLCVFVVKQIRNYKF